jgi:hypothetical protein
MYIKGREIAIGYIDYLIPNLDFEKIENVFINGHSAGGLAAF